MKKLLFTREMLAEFKRDYEAAKHHNHDQFEFHGEVVLVSYAKYVIEYLETQFK